MGTWADKVKKKQYCVCGQYVLSITHLFVQGNYYKCWKRSHTPFVCLCVVDGDTSRQLLIYFLPVLVM